MLASAFKGPRNLPQTRPKEEGRLVDACPPEALRATTTHYDMAQHAPELAVLARAVGWLRAVGELPA
eukprot:5752156-Pyramimonas_sp.AAC.1